MLTELGLTLQLISETEYVHSPLKFAVWYRLSHFHPEHMARKEKQDVGLHVSPSWIKNF
jgi:hypothetical protein